MRFHEAWPDIAPTHVIEFAESAQVTGAAVAPDGSVAYAQIHVDAIDVWRVATGYWPEVLGTLVALVAIAALLVMLRVARRPRGRGRPYCRRCNYDLSEHATREDGGRRSWRTADGVRCPECGTVLRAGAVVTGRGPLKRCAAAWSVALLVGAGYGALFATGVQRGDERLQWFSWPSVELAGSARAKGIAWLTSQIRPINRIAVVDVATGQRLGDLWQGGSASSSAPALSPDGTVLLVRDGMQGVIAIRMRDGRRVRGLRAAMVDHAYPLKNIVAQFAGGSQVAYLVTVDADRQRSNLVAWDLRTGRAAVVAETAAHHDPNRPPPFQVTGRWFSVAEVDGRVVAVSAPGFTEGFAATRGMTGPGGSPGVSLDGTTELHTLEPAGRRTLDVTIGSITRPMLMTGRGVLVDLPTVVDVRTGRPVGPITGFDGGMRARTVDHCDVDPGQRLVIFSSYRRIDVLDLETGALLSSLTYPERYIGLTVFARTCEDHVGVVGFRDARAAGGTFVSALMLFDLAPMREQLAREDAWREERLPGGG